MYNREAKGRTGIVFRGGSLGTAPVVLRQNVRLCKYFVRICDKGCGTISMHADICGSFNIR